MVVRRLILLILSALFALGCQRQIKGTRSSISIQVPKSANAQGKTGGVGAMAAMPSDRKACYGVVISGGGLDDKSATCGPKGSLFLGFVEPGQVITADVEKGKNRTVELFAFLESVGQNDPCPQFAPNLSAQQAVNTFKVGKADFVDMTSDTTEVTIIASFPGVGNHLAQELSLPVSCTATAGGTNPLGFSISAGRGLATGAGMKLLGRFGKPVAGQVATGSGMKLISR
jgi:hypothetical protein